MSVFSIEDDGMKNGCTTKVLITSAIASATANRMGISSQMLPRFLAGLPGLAVPPGGAG